MNERKPILFSTGQFTIEMLEEFARELQSQPIYVNGPLKDVSVNRATELNDKLTLKSKK